VSQNVSPIELDADRLLIANPSGNSEYPCFTTSRLQQISKREIALDPNDLPRANEIIPKDQRHETVAAAARRASDRERKRRAKAIQRYGMDSSSDYSEIELRREA
jgi:hypothetical protein